MTLEDDTMELMSLKQGEKKTLRNFVERYHSVILELGAFSYPQASRALKGRAKVDMSWYNLMVPTINSYIKSHDQVTRIRSKKIDELRRWQIRA